MNDLLKDYYANIIIYFGESIGIKLFLSVHQQSYNMSPPL